MFLLSPYNLMGTCNNAQNYTFRCPTKMGDVQMYNFRGAYVTHFENPQIHNNLHWKLPVLFNEELFLPYLQPSPPLSFYIIPFIYLIFSILRQNGDLRYMFDLYMTRCGNLYKYVKITTA
jgi:hypothetical protein